MSDNATGYRPPTAKRAKRERPTSLPAALAPNSDASTSAPPASGRWFRVIECGVDASGSLRLAPREYLSRAVYDRSTTFRFLVLEAKKLGNEQSIGVTDEQGRLAHLFAGKTGRFATKDQKKLVAAKLLVDGIGTAEAAAAPAPEPKERKKRTSRGAAPPVPNKRTSRKAAAANGEAPAAPKRTSRRPRKPKTEVEQVPAPRSSIWNP